jgi:hypothetical protein
VTELQEGALFGFEHERHDGLRASTLLRQSDGRPTWTRVPERSLDEFGIPVISWPL